MDNYPNYEFYVLNYDFNAKKVINFNIFQNWSVVESVNEAVEKYSRNEMNIDELREEIRKIIAWQEWGRREYEISVGDAFETNCDKLEKWDCYAQALPNINLITDMCINRYKEWIIRQLVVECI
jgi:hypothetical protein